MDGLWMEHPQFRQLHLGLGRAGLVGESGSIEFNLIGEESIKFNLKQGTWHLIIGDGWSLYKTENGESINETISEN